MLRTHLIENGALLKKSLICEFSSLEQMPWTGQMTEITPQVRIYFWITI